MVRFADRQLHGLDDELRIRLRAGLGVAPSPATQAVHRRLLV